MYIKINGTKSVKRLRDGKIIPRNGSNKDYQEYLHWSAQNQTLSAPPKDPKLLRQEIVEKTQERLDLFAKTRGYDGILSACSYDPSTDVLFKQDAERAVYLRDLTWRTLYAHLEKINTGEAEIPTSFSDVEPLLPELTW